MAWTDHPDMPHLAEAVAADLAACCAEALSRRGRALLALAGGSTPMPVYARLARHSLNWPAVRVIPTDERWAAPESPASNLRAIAAELASTGADLRPLVPEDPRGAPSDAFAQSALAKLPGPFDAVVLGMGADGHFASLFPGVPELASGLDPAGSTESLVVVPDPLPPEAPYPRITLTLARLARARRLFLVITGQTKREVALAAARADADPFELPIAALFSRAEIEVEIHWSP